MHRDSIKESLAPIVPCTYPVPSSPWTPGPSTHPCLCVCTGLPTSSLTPRREGHSSICCPLKAGLDFSCIFLSSFITAAFPKAVLWFLADGANQRAFCMFMVFKLLLIALSEGFSSNLFWKILSWRWTRHKAQFTFYPHSQSSRNECRAFTHCSLRNTVLLLRAVSAGSLA